MEDGGTERRHAWLVPVGGYNRTGFFQDLGRCGAYDFDGELRGTGAVASFSPYTYAKSPYAHPKSVGTFYSQQKF